MKYLNGEYYVEVKDQRYRIHPTEKIILRLRDPPTSLRTQHQAQNQAKVRKNQKVIKNDNDELVVKIILKIKMNNQLFNYQLPNCPSCKQNKWLEFDKGYYCKNCEFIINKQSIRLRHRIDRKVLRQDRGFSTRINYANKKIREIRMNMVNTNYNLTEDMINKLQQLKGKTRLNIYKKYKQLLY